MRDSFIFYRSFAEAMKELEPEDKATLLEAIINYALDGKQPACTGAAKGMFHLIKPQIDANNKRYENGKKGGRPRNQNKTKEEPKQNQDKTKIKPNVNENVNDNENVNGNVNVYRIADKETIEKRMQALKEKRAEARKERNQK